MTRSDQRTGNDDYQYSGLFINNRRLGAYLAYCVGLLGYYLWMLDELPDPSQSSSLALAFAIGAIVPICVIFRRELDLLEPMYWFSAMYFAFFLGAVYFVRTDFQYSEHNLISDRIERNQVLFKTLWLVLLGYSVFLVGYLFATISRQRARIIFEGQNQVPRWLIMLAVAGLLSIGFLNFIYLVSNYPGGLFKYYAEMGLRQHRLESFDAGITTVGLQLVYAAVFLWMFVLMRDIRNGVNVSGLRIIVFAIVALGSIAVLAGDGRLFQTISYCLVLAGMLYGFSSSQWRNPAMGFAGVGLIVAGVGLFFGRLVSLLIYNRPDILASLGWTGVVDVFFLTLGRFVLDKGNVTDLTSLMNIVAYWEKDFAFLYGESFLSPVSRLVAGVEIQSIAETTQPLWSTGIGAWPPTFVGELYANFGTVGVIGGMLVAGFLIGRVYVYCTRRRNFWMTFILCALTFRFFFILPKGEMVNLTGTAWLVLPAIATFGILKLFTSVAVKAD